DGFRGRPPAQPEHPRRARVRARLQLSRWDHEQRPSPAGAHGRGTAGWTPRTAGRGYRRLRPHRQRDHQTHPPHGTGLAPYRRFARPARATGGRRENRFLRFRHPRPVRDRLRPRLRRPLSRAASHLFADISAYLGWKKAELHSHLDGAVRISTAEELSGRDGLRMVAPDDCPSQAEYIKYFDDAIAVMQTAAALERIAYELRVDSAAANSDYLQVHWAPRFTLRRGLTIERVIEAVLSGLEAGPIQAVAIVCAMRH